MLDMLQIRNRALPPDPPRRRGASTLDVQQDRFVILKSLLGAVPWLQCGLGIVVILVAALMPWGASKMLAAVDQQILAVDVNGTLVGENRVGLERHLSDWVGKSYFATDLEDIKASLEQRPWVASAAVKRVWPDRLVVNIREKKPLAYWNDGRLVSRTGELFSPENPQVAGALPLLSGPDERVRDVITMARALSDQLVASGMGFSGLNLEQRGAWTLRLNNGIDVVLGRDQVEQRFQRFIAVYQSRLASRADEVSKIDARYTNGVAVKWKAAAAASTPKT